METIFDVIRHIVHGSNLFGAEDKDKALKILHDTEHGTEEEVEKEGDKTNEV